MVAHQMERNGVDLQHALDKPIEMAKEYPVSSMLVVFGVGLGVGVLLSQAVAHLPYAAAEPTVSERLAKQIYDAVSNAIPPSLAKQFHS
jgi:hypothetical protein